MTEFSKAPGASPKPLPADPVAGEFVTETFDYDGGRQVTVYVPPREPEAIVFAGDGQMISPWGRLLDAAVRSTMIVGAHRAEDETLRLHEYSPGFDPERFAAHERFFVEDVGNWVRSRFGPTLSAGTDGCVWCFGRCRARAGPRTSTSRTLWRDFFSLARCGVPAA